MKQPSHFGSLTPQYVGLSHPQMPSGPFWRSSNPNALVLGLGRRYEKSSEAFPLLWTDLKHRVLDAVSNGAFVRKHHEAAATPPPSNSSTDVDLLVAALNQAVRPEMRLRPHMQQ